MTNNTRRNSNQKDKARVVAINLFGIGISILLFLYLLFFLSQDKIKLVFVLAFIILLCLLPPLLNYLKFEKAARFIYNFNAAPFIYYHVFLIGPGMGIELFMILTFSYPFIFLKKEESKWMIFFFFYNAIFLFLTEFVPLTIVESINFSESTAIFVKVSIYVFCCMHAGIFYYLYYQSINLTEKELIDSRNAAERASNIKKEFLASMSHEIRTPLNVVVSIANMLSDKDPKEQKELIDSLKFSSGHLMNVINEILDFSKLEAGKIQLDKNPVVLSELIHNIRNSYEVSAKEKGLVLNLSIDPEIYWLFLIDEVRLNQILGNLLNNALKFTHNGQIDLKLELLEDAGDSQTIRFSVKDTGIGIPEGKLSTIFSSFTQLSASITKKYGGSGLGLNIVLELLKLYNSKLSVETKVGKGSTFSFVIQLEKSKNSKPVNVAELSLSPLSILVVEDYSLNAIIIKKMLHKWGMEVTTAESGMEAISKFMNQKFDLIFMDIHMPEMDGIETTKRIKALEHYNGTPVYALTADITAAHQTNIMSNFDGFLSKPLENNKIKEVLSKYAE